VLWRLAVRSLLAVLCFACGSVNAPPPGLDSLPDGPPPVDAGEPPDAPIPDAVPTFVTDSIEGRWTFTFQGMECSVTVEDGGYYVLCPEAPVEIVPGCTSQTWLRMQGTLADAFEGQWDTVKRNEGLGCTAEHMPGVDQVESAWAIMGADRTGPASGAGFWQQMYGPWDWAVVVSADPDEGFFCKVTFAPAMVDSRANWEVECCETRADVAPMCAHESCGILHGTIGAAQMDGEVREEERYAGSGCVAGGYPDPVVQTGTVKSMSATRD